MPGVGCENTDVGVYALADCDRSIERSYADGHSILVVLIEIGVQ